MKKIQVKLAIPKKNLVSLLIVLCLIVGNAIFISLFFNALTKTSKIKVEIASKESTAARFVKRGRVPITKESIATLTEQENVLGEIYSQLKEELESTSIEEIPNTELEPLQFKERLIQTQKKIREYAKAHGLLLPASIGFAKYETELTSPSDSPYLIRRLKVAEELITLIALSKIESLEELRFINSNLTEDVKEEAKTISVKHEEGADRRGSMADIHPRRAEVEGTVSAEAGMPHDILGEPPKEEVIKYFDIPLSLKLKCSNAELMDFLYKLSASKHIFIVDDLDMKGIGSVGTSSTASNTIREEKSEQASEAVDSSKKYIEANLLLRAVALQ